MDPIWPAADQGGYEITVNGVRYGVTLEGVGARPVHGYAFVCEDLYLYVPGVACPAFVGRIAQQGARWMACATVDGRPVLSRWLEPTDKAEALEGLLRRALWPLGAPEVPLDVRPWETAHDRLVRASTA